MAYINAAAVKVIRDELKATFPAKAGWKFSVRGSGGHLSVSVMTAPIDLLCNGVIKTSGIHHQTVNHYWINENGNKVYRDVFNLINDIIKRKWYDNSDIQTDYFETAFYYDIEIGKWDTSYEVVEAKTAWSHKDAIARFKKQTAINLLAAA